MGSKSLVLIHNKDERTTARQILIEADALVMPGNLKDGLAELQKEGGDISLLILDERFDQAVDSDVKIIDLLEAFLESGTRSPNAVIMVILNESTTTLEIPVLFAEAGADVFLHRPFGIEELRQRFSEALRWIDAPPPLIKLTRVIQEQVRRKQFAEITPGLESLHQKHPQNVRIGMLLAKVLVESGPATLPRGLEIALGYDCSHPESLFTKKLLVAGYESLGKTRDAFAMAIRLYAANPSDAYFDKCFELAQKLSSDPAYADFQHWNDFLATFSKMEPARTRERRLQVIQRLTELNPPLSFFKPFFERLNADCEDILPRLENELAKWVLALKMGCADPERAAEYEPVLIEALRSLLALDPGAPAAIETLVDILIARKEQKLAAKYLQKARDQKKHSVEFYSAYTKLALSEDMLKEASDMMHAGRRLAPSDDRWDILAKIWAEKYAKANP